MGYTFYAEHYPPEPSSKDIEALELGFKQVTDPKLHNTAGIREEDSRWLMEATESVLSDMRSWVHYDSLTFEEKVDELPKEAKERIEKASHRGRQTETEVANRARAFRGYLLTLAFLQVGLERILGESHIDARHHKSTKFISARDQILAALWISMESAGLGRIVSSKD